MAGPSSPNGVATTSFDAPGRHRARPSFGSPSRICTARHTRTHRYLRMPSGPRVRPAQSQLSGTAPKRAQAVSGIVSKNSPPTYGGPRVRIRLPPAASPVQTVHSFALRPLALKPEVLLLLGE